MMSCSVDTCDGESHAKGLCVTHYWRLRKHGDPLADVPVSKRRKFGLTSLEEIFHHFMPGDPPDEGCWEWTSTRTTGGYGVFGFGEDMLRAHVVSYTLYRGPVPAGLVVRHDPVLCNNPPCVQPFEHLLLGTQAENNADMVIAGTSTRGERNPQARLTESDVREIRRRYAEGGVLQRELAADYGVTRVTVSDIVNRRRWGWAD